MAQEESQEKQKQQKALEPETTETTATPTMTLDTQVLTTTSTPCASATTTITTTTKLPTSSEATIIDIPSSSSPSPSSYDTDSSTVSSTCCTHPNEYIYMERPRQQPQQQQHLQHHHHHHQFPAPDAEVNVELLQYKAEQRKSWPFFVLVISLIEIAVFLFDYMTVRPQPTLQAPIPSDSVLIYRPDRRQQLWRFISYMVLHANWFHLSFNVVIQLLFGIPLEVMHGSARIAVIYFAGVFAGSLGTSVVDSEVYLVGASGGVYALLAAHLANIMLNYGQMKYAVAQLVSVLIFVSCDLGYAFYTQYLAAVQLSQAPAVSYIAHLTGALAGLTIGLLVLRNFEHRAHENLIWWLALGVYTAFTIFAIVFNLINTVTAQLMEEQGEVITQHLLHDLGVS